MIDNLEDLSCLRLRALENIEANKLRIAKYYDKKVKIKQFFEGDLVWKVKLPIRSKDSKFGKWSPNWEGPYRIKRCAPGNAYILETLRGEKEFGRAINGNIYRNITIVFRLILDNRFVRSSALIADTRRVSPLVQK